ncbi:uncharacterized protein SAPINGB_P000544 [Magnusiomyces paraingens]|uniref:Uncharacterized protein n=1 Tax=Magnusiomyces paraingens TaxID=2606893 RepID=A0A5E8B0U2_9ASCO|nr:uncharacterized protein SAPINGB_P000544 [Saprochaete ingens]VVT44818.1 unnamed protein product [Saprochaete ingens]
MSCRRSGFEREASNLPVKRPRLDGSNSEESNNDLNSPVDNSKRQQLDSLTSKFKEVCNLEICQETNNDFSAFNFRISSKEGKTKKKEENAQKRTTSTSKFYAQLLHYGLEQGHSTGDINTIAKLMDHTEKDITMLENKFEKICEVVEKNGQYNGNGPNYFGTGVTRFQTCSKGCTCIVKTSQKNISTCAACKTPYNPNVQAILLSVRENYREKFKNKKIAEVEWLNVNRYIENLRAQKKDRTPEHLQRMLNDGLFDLENSKKKKKVIDIPFVIVMDAISVSASTHLGYNATGGFNLAENSLQMKSSENVHPIYIYPKVKSHVPSNKPIKKQQNDAESSDDNFNLEDFFNAENGGDKNANEDELSIAACGVFQPLVDEFTSLSKFGFKVYDAFNKEEITVRVHWLYTIGDMAAVSELLGGRYAANLRCCVRCNIFKSPLFYKEGKFTRSVLSFIHSPCHTEKLSTSEFITKKKKNGVYDENKKMDLTNNYYESEILPYFDKKTGKVSDTLMASQQEIYDLQEPNKKMKKSTHIGFKLKSPLFDLPYFSLPYSFPPDVMHAQAINILKLLLSIILDPSCEGKVKNQIGEKIDISGFVFNEEQMDAYFEFLGLLDEHTPQAFRDNICKPEKKTATLTYWLKSAAQGEALLKSLYLLREFIPNLTERQEYLLFLYSQMAVLMMINNSSHINKDLNLDLVQASWNNVIRTFERLVTLGYNKNGFIGTLPLHTMLHTPGYLKKVGPLKTFSSYATERMVKSVKESQQNSRYPIIALCNYQLKSYVIKLIFIGQATPEILSPTMKLSGKTEECTTDDELKLLDLLKKSLVKNYPKYGNGKNQLSSNSHTSYSMNLLFDKKTGNFMSNSLDSDTYYYRRYRKIHWNTSKYTAIASSSKSGNATNELDTFVRVTESRNSSASKSPSYYAKLLDCFSVRKETEEVSDLFAIVEKIPEKSLKSLDVDTDYNDVIFGAKMKLGFYWENEYKQGERIVVPLNRIANPVFIIPQYNFRLSNSKKTNRFFILDPNVFLEFSVGSKTCQLLLLDEHININQKELDYIEKFLKNKDSVVIKTYMPI